jgi:hypothetical protein
VLFRRRRDSYKKRGREPQTMWRHVFYGVGVCAVVVLVLTLVWYVTRLPFATISTITVEGGETVPASLVKSKVERVLRESYLRIIPYRFSYLYPHDRIVNALHDIDRIKDVEVNRVGRIELVVSYTEYRPYALWCSEGEVPLCFFIDEHGFAYEVAPQLDGGTLVRHIFQGSHNPERGLVIPYDAFVASHAFIDALLASLSLRVTHVEYTHESDATFTVHGGGKILMSRERTVEDVLQNLKTILDSDAFSHLEPGNFNYIDLRFGNKVFVNEEFPEEVATTTSSTSELEVGE